MRYYLDDLFTQTRDTDPDLRFMALNDLDKELLDPESKFTPEAKEDYAVILTQCLDDQFSEVRSQALKCFETLTPTLGPYVADVVKDLASRKPEKASITSSIYTMAVHNILKNLVPSEAVAKDIVKSLLDNLLGNEETLFKTIDCIEVLSDLIEYLGKSLNQTQVGDTADTLVRAAFGADPIIAKKSVSALALLSRHVSTEQRMNSLVASLLAVVTDSPTAHNKTVALAALSALIKSNPTFMAAEFGTVEPFAVQCLSLDTLSDPPNDDFDLQQETDDVRGEALMCLATSFQQLPAKDLEGSTEDCLRIAADFVPYDPYSENGDDTEGKDDSMDEDDFGDEDEEDDYYSDEEDEYADDDDASGNSWRLRKNAVVLVSAILHKLPTRLPSIYRVVFTALVSQLRDVNSAVVSELLTCITAIFRHSRKNGPYYSLKALSALRDSATGRRGSDISMQTDEDPFAILVAKSSWICESVAKLITLTNASKLSLFYNFVASLSDSTEGLQEPWADTFVAKLDSIRDGPVNSDLVKFYSSLLETNNLQAVGSSLQTVVKNVTSALESSNHELVLDGLVLLNSVLSHDIPRDSPSADTLQLFASFDELLIEKTTNKNYSTEIRQKSLHSLASLVLNVPLEDSKLSASLQVFADIITIELLVSDDMSCIQLIASSSIKQHLSGDWIQQTLGPLAEYIFNTELRTQSLKTIYSLIDAGLLNETQKKEIAAAVVKLCTSQRVSLQDECLCGQILTTISESTDIGDLTPFIAMLTKFSKTSDYDDAVLSEFTKSLLKHTDDSQKLIDAVLQHGDQTDSHIVKLLAIISVAAGHDNSIASILDDLKRGKQILFSLVFLEQAAKAAADLDTDLTPFIQYLDISEKDTKHAATKALTSLVASNPERYMPEFLQTLSDATDQTTLLGSLSEILKTINLTPEQSKQVFDVVSSVENNSQAKVEDREYLPAAQSLAQIALNDHQFIDNLHDSLLSDSANLNAAAATAVKYLLDDDSFLEDNVSQLSKYLDLASADNFLFHSDLHRKEIGIANLLKAVYKRPQVALPLIAKLMPKVLEEEMAQRKEYVKMVRIGPFKHKLDDALGFRKDIYELIYSVLTALDSNSSLNFVCPIDWSLVLKTIIARAFKDDPQIIFLALLIILKIISQNPDIFVGNQLLPDLITAFNKKLNKKLKEDAPKQEVEKRHETTRAILRCCKKIDSKVDHGDVKLDGDVLSQWKSFMSDLRQKYPIIDSATY